ncbi:type I-E CRISPR-associated protein Cas6/Cse3/CasE [Pseudonocardia adelaidensis]|uniref:Type I-E CRISPR-associated protein Cas6/Cse3/CasE n=1 Tax=Pseudonocardia adelaidensis TaxID=648754 RepID=A0ABP9NGW5_9PSEU
MHLTRFEINPRRRTARELLASPQRLHAAVLAAFPSSRPEPDEGRILWRLDQGQHDHLLYVVSPLAPDLTHLAESVGRPTYGWQTKDYEPFLGKLTAGDRWAFRLRANPVHNAPPADGNSRGKRLPHVTADQQTAWFLQRAQRAGFSVVDGTAGAPDVVLRDRRAVRFDRRGRIVTLNTALFEGTLVVEDPAALRTALVAGIGPGKGYGCGLLTLAAPR